MEAKRSKRTPAAQALTASPGEEIMEATCAKAGSRAVLTVSRCFKHHHIIITVPGFAEDSELCHEIRAYSCKMCKAVHGFARSHLPGEGSNCTTHQSAVALPSETG